MTNTKLSKFHGSLTALITPMLADGTVDFPSLQKLIEMHVEAGTHGIVVMGTTGEASTMDEIEYFATIQQVVDFVDGRVPVIAGSGKNCTVSAIENVQKLADCGIDGCLSVTPYYNKPTQEGLFQHYKAIAEATDLPQILYNVPSRTGVDLVPETVGRLAEIQNIVGIKEATGDITRVKQIKSLVGDDFVLLSGDDASFVDFIAEGGHGTISVTNNIVPAQIAKICELALVGKLDEAYELNQKLMPLHQTLFIESNPIPVKWAMHRLNMILTPNLRLPLTILSEASQGKVEEALRSSGLLA